MAEVAEAQDFRANLQLYKGELLQVEQLLLDDPANEEYQSLYESLAEVIRLAGDIIGGAEQGHLGEQIRQAQQRAALLGQAPRLWAVGAKCVVRYSGDGQWYNAVVQAVSASGAFVVRFEGYGTEEEVDMESVQMESLETDGGYQGVAAPKRRKVTSDLDTADMPRWLEVRETDDDKTRQKKSKLQKSFKSQMRFQKMDVVQNQKAAAWKSFVQGKGAKKATGFLTNMKKESMFAVPQGGRVGVTGSGRGMTGYQRQKKHEFNEATPLP